MADNTETPQKLQEYKVYQQEYLKLIDHFEHEKLKQEFTDKSEKIITKLKESIYASRQRKAETSILKKLNYFYSYDHYLYGVGKEKEITMKWNDYKSKFCK